MGTSQRRTSTSYPILLLLSAVLAPACTVSVEPGAVVIDLPGIGGSAGQSGGAGEAGSAGTGGEAGEGQTPDGGTPPASDCSVSFVSPSPSAIPLTFGPADDRDGTPCGSTFATDVVVASSGVSVTLFVDDTPWSAQLVSDAASSFPGVLLGTRTPALSALRAVATMADGSTCEATLASLGVDCEGPSCTLSGPSSSAALSDADDADPSAAGLQASFSLHTDLDNTGTEAHLILNGDEQAALSGTFQSNTLTFASVTLAEGAARTLQGECRDASGNITRSAIATWSVALAACQVDIVSPAPGSDPLTLGPGDDQDSEACGTDFTTSVDVDTNAASLALLVDGQAVESLAVSAGSAHFDNVVLGTRSPSASAISVQATMADGRTCVAARDNLIVDCEGPSCSLVATSNSPFFNLGNDEDLQALGLQTSFRVDTDADNIDQGARLIVDDDDGAALTAVFDPAAEGASASFTPVTLTEGPLHTVRAECEDPVGNVTRSATLSWAVDLTPCAIEIDSVANDADPITRAIDQAPLATGIQVDVVGRVTGSACTGVRVGVCGQPLGVFADAAITAGGEWSLPVTLADVTGPGEVCAQVQDDAQNVVEARLPVNVRGDNPVVEIASPPDSALINLLGTNGAIADLTPASPSCELAVQIDCTDVGSAVALSVDGTPLPQQAVCLVDGNAAPPFHGRATFDSVSLGALSDTHTLMAQQTVAGLVGSSIPITVNADCAAPALAFAQPLCGGQLHLVNDDAQSGSAGLQHDVAVSNGGVAQVSLTVARLGSSQTLSAAGDATTTSFANVTFGAPGDVTLTASASDAAGNASSASCQVTVVVEPTVNILGPTVQQVLTTTNDCVPVGGGFGINVNGTTSADPGSSVQVAIGAGAPVDLASVAAGSGGLNTFSGCVAIPDGVNQTITVTVTDAPNPPGNNTVLVSVDTRAPTDPVLAPLATITSRRQGRVTFTWDHVADADGSPLAGYDLHCAAAPITDEAGWSAARALPVNTVGAPLGSPPATEQLPGAPCTTDACHAFRVGTTEFCVMRGRDIAGALTPLAGASGNVTVSVPFVSTPFTSVLNGNSSFTNVVGLGDVNGDGFEDMLYGVTPLGLQLFFGGPSFDTTADVSFTNGGVSAFGAVLASVGDVNGDGIGDFAASARALGGNAGTVYLFFGRADNTWPASINVTSGGCGADVCLVGSAAGAFFGWDITGTNFDGSGPNDLVISARVANGVGAVYVILGGSQLNVATGTSISVPAGNPNGFVITPPASRSNFGVAVAAVGSGADGRGDLAIGANGAGSANPAVLFYLQGEAYPIGSSGLIAPSASPMLEVAIGSSGDFASPVRAVGDVDGDGLGDLALGRNFSAGGGLGAAQLFRRNGAIFTAGADFFFDFAATGVDNDYGTFIATGLHPLLGNVGDLDGDGRSELAIGSLQGATGGSVALFYGAQPITSRLRGNADFTLAASSTSVMVPNFVGDIDGDGFDDLAVVDGGAGADRIILLR